MEKQRINIDSISRHQLLNSARAFGLGAALERLAPAYARTTGQAQSPVLSGNVVDLVVVETPFRLGDGRDCNDR